MLSNDDIQDVLERAMETQFARSRPAIVNFFSHNVPDAAQQPLTVAIHKWAMADVHGSDTLTTIKGLARIIVKEVAGVSLTLTGEMVFGLTGLLPRQPLWSDESPLFASHDSQNQDRFGVHGGNIIDSVGCFSDDVANAVDRLVELDQDGAYDTDEHLRIFCAKPLERKLMRACAKAGAKCRVFGIRDHKENRSWVISRNQTPCSMLMTQPSFVLPVQGNKLVAGAKFVVWVNDPRLAVYVAAKELE